jgi:hypothetical protein
VARCSGLAGKPDKKLGGACHQHHNLALWGHAPTNRSPPRPRLLRAARKKEPLPHTRAHTRVDLIRVGAVVVVCSECYFPSPVP